MKTIYMLVVCLVVAGCSKSVRPVLYPNAHLNAVGQEQAQRDIAQCGELADAYVKNAPARDAAKDTAVGGTIGAATGAAAGAVWGHAGRGAAAGAAGGVTAGAMRGIFRAKDPSPVYKNFVNRCLREKGYDPIGWQ
ncbi:MAG: cell envelope biogenesis protein OmpA [Deltaproteobacteria bacterium]|nr:cell envelope biogenesis protein OmpA [Deltaproteobacteria bacterium]